MAQESGRIFPAPHASRSFPLPPRERVAPQPYYFPQRDTQKATLVELCLDACSRLYSFQGVSSSYAYWTPKLVSISAARREIGLDAGEYRVSDVDIILANTDREFSIIIANESIINRVVKVYLISLDDNEAALPAFFTGVVRDYEISEGTIVLHCVDAMLDRFDQSLSATLATINTTTFPNMPTGATYIGQLVPVLYGDVQVAGAQSGNLAYPAYLIDNRGPYIYVCFQMKTSGEFIAQALTDNFHVRTYGAASTTAAPTLSVATYGGVTMAILTYANAQADASRPDETEVTYMVKGINDIENSGTVLKFPVHQLRHFIKSWVPGVADSDFDYGSNRTIAARASGNSSLNEALGAEVDVTSDMEGFVWIGGDATTTFRDVLHRWRESFFLDVWITRGGTYGMNHFITTATRDSSLDWASLRGYISLNESEHIIDGSFKVLRNEDVLTSVYSRHLWNVTDDTFRLTVTRTNTVSLTALRNRATQLALDARFAARNTNQNNLGDAMLAALSPLNRVYEFRVPIDHLWSLDLFLPIEIVHRAIPGSYRSEVLKDVPLAYWRLDETHGTSAFDEMALADLTYAASPSLSKPSLLVSDANAAVRFNGTSQYASRATDTASIEGMTVGSFEALVQMTALTGLEQAIVARWRYTGGFVNKFWNLYLTAAGVLNLQLALAGSSTAHTSGVTLTAGQRYHVCVTVDGANVRFYVDGYLRATSAWANTLKTGEVLSITPVVLAASDSGINDFFAGTIDEPAIYATALSADRIRQHYLASLAKHSPTAVARVIGLEVNSDPEVMDILVRALEVRAAI